MDEKERQLIKKTEGEARRVLEDPHKTEKLADNAENKLEGLTEKLVAFTEQIALFISLIRDYCTGEYRQVPWRLVLSATAALIWFVNPFDLVPDFITGVGLIDDALVAGLVVGSFRTELETYRTWRKGLNSPNGGELPAAE